MHVHFEQNTSTRTECTIHTLSWMGKVPESLPEEDGGWKLNRSQYYSEGWLASGNAKGIVGITFTTSHCKKYDAPQRSNFNLRGHRSEVILVRWNEPYQKLATCDSQGVIFVWIKHEGRWSIELINDRNSQVTDFAWSHDGRMALICYCDGFVLVGSVAGQRYWSSMLNLDSTTITCGVWSPDDQKVIFGTTGGQLIVMSSTGAMLTQVVINDGMEICAMSWSCEKFNMDESDSKNSTASSISSTEHTLSICFKYGAIYLMASYDDLCPRVIHTLLTENKTGKSELGLASRVVIDLTRDITGSHRHLYCDNFFTSPWLFKHLLDDGIYACGTCRSNRKGFPSQLNKDSVKNRGDFLMRQTGLKMDWSNCGEVLAVGGFIRLPNLECRNEVHFYSREGKLMHWISIPSQGKPLTALCWGHNDRRLFMAAGYNLYVAWVTKQVAPLQFLCQRVIQDCIQQEKKVNKLPLPSRLRHSIQALFSPTIKSYIPDPFKLREFVASPPPGNERLFCTMVRHGEETSGGHYTLYLEYLGGLIPLLKGKRASKLRPDFVIFDPKIKTRTNSEAVVNGAVPVDEVYYETESDTDSDISTDGCGSPRMQRKKRPKNFRAAKVDRSITFRTLDELLYNDNLPESNKLVDVTSNIWGTKFHILGISPFLPEDLGHILYKTSLLHLQPRQMTVTVTEVTMDPTQLSRDHNFSPARAMEDDSDQSSLDDILYDPGDYCHDEGILVVTETTGNNKLTSQVVVDVLPANSSASASDDNRQLMDFNSDNYGTCLAGSNDRPIRTPNMKNRSLSPATESLAQNNAFNFESSSVLKDKYVGQGAKPKVKNVPISGSQMTEVNVSTASDEYSTESSSTPSVNGVMRTSLQNEVEHIMKYDDENRWADRANCGIKFIDDEKEMKLNETNHENTVVCDSSQLTPTSSDVQKRLYLAASQELLRDIEKDPESLCDRRESLDSLATEDSANLLDSNLNLADNESLGGNSCFSTKSTHSQLTKDFFTNGPSLSENFSPDFEINHSASLPASPIRRSPKSDSPTRHLREEVLKGRCKHYSPIFKRKSKYSPHTLESSDEDISSSVEEIRFTHNYKNLESFQKAQFKQKLRKVRRRSEDRSGFPVLGCRQFVMHNKAPLWNDNSQVYQLDFGGRVTQESAKNFQIEFRGRQVMQFGRIDSNAYTLDFQYPFTAIQAFAVALANVTQRLK